MLGIHAAAQACAVALGVLFVFVPGVLGWTNKPFNPPAIPLAVSSPYTSAWLMNGNGTALNSDWPKFWNDKITAWASMVIVDSITYQTMGPIRGGDLACDQLSMQFTATSSIFTLRCGLVDFTYTFISPIDPDDLVRFSLPFSYLIITAQSNDGRQHSVKVYTDITGEWLTSDLAESITWQTSATEIITHRVQFVDQRPFQETNNRILDGAVYFSTMNRKGITFRAGAVDDVRTAFQQQGALTTPSETGPRAINDRWPTFAFAVDLGSVGPQGLAQPVVFGIGHARESVVQYAVAGGIQDRVPYFMTKHATAQDALEFFMGDWQNATRTASLVDAQVDAHASKVSANYSAILSLAMRQAIAPMELTAARKSDGSVDASDVLLFFRQNSAGYNGWMNGVDMIYAMWPLFTYINPQLSKAVLEPVLRYIASNVSPYPYCLQSIGQSYPNATGLTGAVTEPHPMPVEASADMLIMTFSYSQRTGDLSLINTYYELLNQWATYLGQNTLIPTKQEQAETWATPSAKMTNLAVKGIIALAAMSEMAKLANRSDDMTQYSTTTKSYIAQWKTMALSNNGQHLTYSYDNNQSWILGFNLYMDKLLKTNIVEPDVFVTQESWLKSRVNAYGIQADSTAIWTVSNWEMWTAAYVQDAALQHAIIDSIVAFHQSGRSAAPMPTFFDSETAKPDRFRARTDVGGHFAFLALQGDQLTIQRGFQLPSESDGSNSAASASSFVARTLVVWFGLCWLSLLY